MGKLRLAVVQPRTIRPEESANVERAAVYARQAGDAGAQIVAFPECYPGPYSGPTDYDARDALMAVAREFRMHVAYGFMEAVPGTGAYHNVYQLLGPDGSVAARYAKMIPSPVDGELSGKKSMPGESFALAQVAWGKVGLLICWEAWFPELCRTLAMQGADLVLFPTGGMLYHLAPVWSTLIQARATENLIYTASCVNLFGVEDGFAFVCGPEGELASSSKEGVLVADLDLDRLRYLRQEDESLAFPKLYKTIPGLWRHNRTDLYQPAPQVSEPYERK
jgi:predicted amidohydrolase